jgi:hypothetical protein
MTIRQPSTANLMIDSADRATGYAGNFEIQRPQALMNGFFTRVATTEVVIEWGIPNIMATLSNQTFSVTITSGSVLISITLPESQYTVAQALDAIAGLLTAANATYLWTIVQLNGLVYLKATLADGTTAAPYTINTRNLSVQLGLVGNDSDNLHQVGEFGAVDLRFVRYLDFVSNSLTYTQAVKDSSTNPTSVKDVLCRFYFDWDNPPQIDKYGFPIQVGYTTTTLRRIFSPPKEIRWESNLPIGNLSFQVYYAQAGLISGFGASPYQLLVPPNVSATDALQFNWLMTLQVSEV